MLVTRQTYQVSLSMHTTNMRSHLHHCTEACGASFKVKLSPCSHKQRILEDYFKYTVVFILWGHSQLRVSLDAGQNRRLLR